MLTDLELSRLWSKVDKSGGPDACWPWTACSIRGGYGRIAMRGRLQLAHRVAVWAATGSPVDPDMEVCHRCDNPSCCNPAHLFVGTHSENIRDSVRKGRFNVGRMGSGNGRAKLDERSVASIRSERHGGASLSQLARKFGVSKTQISLIVTGAGWSHVPMEV